MIQDPHTERQINNESGRIRNTAHNTNGKKKINRQNEIVKITKRTLIQSRKTCFQDGKINTSYQTVGTVRYTFGKEVLFKEWLPEFI